jgi:hypothetical protein
LFPYGFPRIHVCCEGHFRNVKHRSLKKRERRKAVEDLEREALDQLTLDDEMARSWREFYPEDFKEVDLRTEYAVTILTSGGYTYNVETGAWTREVTE